MLYLWLSVLLNIQLITAQFPPEPEGITILKSRFGDGVTISYKEASNPDI
jgi:hypothetical protein